MARLRSKSGALSATGFRSLRCSRVLPGWGFLVIELHGRSQRSATQRLAGTAERDPVRDRGDEVGGASGGRARTQLPVADPQGEEGAQGRAERRDAAGARDRPPFATRLRGLLPHDRRRTRRIERRRRDLQLFDPTPVLRTTRAARGFLGQQSLAENQNKVYSGVTRGSENPSGR